MAATLVGLAALVGGAALVAPKVAAARMRRGESDESVLEPSVLERVRVPTSDGGYLSVVRTGQGNPIVLSHGVTLSVRAWTKQLATLPRSGFEVIAYDHRGHGSSSDAGRDPSVARLGTDLADLLEGLDLSDAVIVGHSMGGVATLALLVDHPEVVARRVAGVVLVSTLARIPVGSQATRVKQSLRRLTRRVPDTTPLWRSPDLGLLAARVGFGRAPNVSHVELVRQMILECPVETRTEAGVSLVGTDLTEGLASIDVPTLVVVGDHDVVTPLHNSKLLARRIPGARLEVLAGVGHMPMLESADALDDLIVAFADSLVRAS